MPSKKHSDSFNKLNRFRASLGEGLGEGSGGGCDLRPQVAKALGDKNDIPSKCPFLRFESATRFSNSGTINGFLGGQLASHVIEVLVGGINPFDESGEMPLVEGRDGKVVGKHARG